jgi:hypothetical protein
VNTSRDPCRLDRRHCAADPGASTVTYLLPVVAIVLGVLVLGETVTAMMLPE